MNFNWVRKKTHNLFDQKIFITNEERRLCVAKYKQNLTQFVDRHFCRAIFGAAFYSFMFLFYFIYVLHVPKGVCFVCVYVYTKYWMWNGWQCGVYDYCGFSCELQKLQNHFVSYLLDDGAMLYRRLVFWLHST